MKLDHASNRWNTGMCFIILYMYILLNGSGRIFRNVQRRIEDVWTHKQACQHLKTYGRWNWINHRFATILSVRRMVKSRCLHEVLHYRENIVFSALLLQCSRTILTPFVVYKALRAPSCSTWMKRDPPGTANTTTASGCWNLQFLKNGLRRFELKKSSWIEEAPSNRANNTVIDGHGSHMTFKIASFEIQNNVTILLTQVMLFNGVFKPLKTKWREILKVCARESRMSGVDKANFSLICCQSYGANLISVLPQLAFEVLNWFL